MKKTIIEALKASIPIMMGYIVLGIAFGMLLESKGYGIWYALAMSVFIYAGSMQFVTINLLTSGATLISATVMTLLINARHLVYGLSMLDKYREMGKLKPYMIFSLTDETYSLLVATEAPDNCNQKWYMFFVSMFDQCYWIIGSVLGNLLGSLISINTNGLDFAMTALFVVIVVNQFIENKNHKYSYVGFIVSIISLLVFGANSFIIPAMIGIIICLGLLYSKEEQANG